MSKETIPGDRIVQSIHWVRGPKVLLEFGERTRLACWRWRPRHRELFLRPLAAVFKTQSASRFSARRRKEHAVRVCSPA